jgi:hypothetical protein
MGLRRSGSGEKWPDANSKKRMRERALRRPFSFEVEAHRQSLAVAMSTLEPDDQDFIDALSQ